MTQPQAAAPEEEPRVTWARYPLPSSGRPAARLTLDHPRLRNALTLPMYDQLERACEQIDADPEIRVTVVRGAGERALAAGTDIREFREFGSGADGVAYERRIGRALERLAGLRMPAIAAVRGAAVGAGLAVAACCDLVVCTPDAVFGAPVARTLGNCLAAPVVARLYAGLGRARTLRALLTAELIGAQEAHDAGFATELAEPGDLDRRVDELAESIARCAPLTLQAVKETDRRILAAASPGHADDLYRLCYGSRDFREGVAAFLAKRPPDWEGR